MWVVVVLGLQVAFNLHTVAMENGHLNGRKFVEISFQQKLNMEKNTLATKKDFSRFGLSLFEYFSTNIFVLFVCSFCVFDERWTKNAPSKWITVNCVSCQIGHKLNTEHL